MRLRVQTLAVNSFIGGMFAMSSSLLVVHQVMPHGHGHSHGQRAACVGFRRLAPVPCLLCFACRSCSLLFFLNRLWLALKIPSVRSTVSLFLSNSMALPPSLAPMFSLASSVLSLRVVRTQRCLGAVFFTPRAQPARQKSTALNQSAKHQSAKHQSAKHQSSRCRGRA